jgi:arylsulfatase|tara:strand:- start:2163 stop:3869 length:1707 start_codon:yes stop_codon:yes gene_type:complete
MIRNSMKKVSLPFVFCLTATALFAARQPNLVIIMSDDMGFSDIGCYGGEIETPNLDKLAANGLRFTQFYNTSRCCPTRASLLSGMYQHQAGIGLMERDNKLPGYRGELGRDVVSIAEALGTGDYRRYMCGKWHVTKFVRPQGPKDNWPLQRGFEKFYGTITGAGSFYDPATLCRGNTFVTPVNDDKYQPKTYYYTDAISDNAVAFLREHAKESPDQPAFLYLAYTTAHWPLHALPRDIAKYKGKYDGGFDPVRAKRFKRLKEMGLIGEKVKLSHRPDDWERTPNKEWEIRNMEVYAAMVDNMDQGIGRVVAEFERQGTLDDTLIFFLQDNGGCAEGFGRYKSKRPYRADLKPLGTNDLQSRIWPPMQTRDGRPVRNGPDAMAGPADSFTGYARGWANVSNTPFREYKHFAHEGGISTPLVAHWPKGIDSSLNGKLNHQPGHVIDLMATCLEVADIPHPKKFGGKDIQPLEGVSLQPAFKGKKLKRKEALFFEHHLNCAVRDGQWKLVRYGETGREPKLRPWELFDMSKDRTETNDLSKKHPDKVKALNDKWEQWAARARVKPWPWKLD